MDDDQLEEIIERIQNTLARELTDEQLDTLRHTLETQPVVREAVLEELQVHETASAAELPTDHLTVNRYRRGVYMTRCDESFFLSELDRARIDGT